MNFFFGSYRLVYFILFSTIKTFRRRPCRGQRAALRCGRLRRDDLPQDNRAVRRGGQQLEAVRLDELPAARRRGRGCQDAAIRLQSLVDRHP